MRPSPRPPLSRALTPYRGLTGPAGRPVPRLVVGHIQTVRQGGSRESGVPAGSGSVLSHQHPHVRATDACSRLTSGPRAGGQRAGITPPCRPSRACGYGAVGCAIAGRHNNWRLLTWTSCSVKVAILVLGSTT